MNKQVDSKRKPAKFKRKYAHMTDDEVVSQCEPIDRPRARRVVADLREYLTRLTDSEGFDIGVYPGSFSGLPDIRPKRFCGDDTIKYGSHGWLAELGMAKYNATHKETKFEFVKVDSVNVSFDIRFCTYYITFFAKVPSDGITEPILKTFQTSLMTHRTPPTKGLLSRIIFCRLKPT